MADSQNNVTQDPWAATQAATDSTTSADPWGSTTDTATQATDAAQSWLHTATPETQFDWLNPFDETLIPFGDWVESAINWLVANFRGFFQAVSAPVDYVLSLFQTLLTTLPTPFMILALVLIAWQLTNTKMALTTLVSLLAIGAIGAWDQMLITLALVLTSVSFCLIIGLPLGIWLARSKRATKFVTPLLDAMQTTPAFVYLVPIVMLFGIGNVPGVVVTIIFALPPVVRLTILGIKQVPESLVEAGNAFGATPNQLLFKVQLPLAKHSIMAGINQTLMLSLSMVVSNWWGWDRYYGHRS